MLITYNGKVVALGGKMIQIVDDTVNDYVEDDYVSNYFENNQSTDDTVNNYVEDDYVSNYFETI